MSKKSSENQRRLLCGFMRGAIARSSAKDNVLKFNEQDLKHAADISWLLADMTGYERDPTKWALGDAAKWSKMIKDYMRR